jgi:hypothetical protein
MGKKGCEQSAAERGGAATLCRFHGFWAAQQGRGAWSVLSRRRKVLAVLLRALVVRRWRADATLAGSQSTAETRGFGRHHRQTRDPYEVAWIVRQQWYVVSQCTRCDPSVSSILTVAPRAAFVRTELSPSPSGQIVVSQNDMIAQGLVQ